MAGFQRFPAPALRLAASLAALALPLIAFAQVPTAVPVNLGNPVNAAWAGEWRAADFNLPPVARTLTTHRDAATLQVKATMGGEECTASYDGLVQAADIITRIEERADWQLKAENWPAGTDPAQLVGLKKEFDQALRVARSLPPDTYRRVRFSCPGENLKDDRFHVLNERRRLFEFRFPDNGLGVRVTLFERVR